MTTGAGIDRLAHATTLQDGAIPMPAKSRRKRNLQNARQQKKEAQGTGTRRDQAPPADRPEAGEQRSHRETRETIAPPGAMAADGFDPNADRSDIIADLVFRGVRDPDYGSIVTFATDRESADDARPLPAHTEVAYHDSRFDWGCRSSAARQLSIAILFEYFRRTSRAGNEHALALAYFNSFAEDVVRTLSREWSMRTRDIREFLEGTRSAE